MDTKIFDLEKLIDLRHQIHSEAEQSFLEFKTTEKIINFLFSIGIDKSSIRRIAKTAIVVDIKGKAPKSGYPKTIAFRADMDALEMTEENPLLEYQSKTKAAHMCGHDGHITCLLGGVCKILERINEIPEDKVVRLLFQPAEEKYGGAYPMIQEGCLEGVDEVYGFHNWPTYPEGMVAIKSGAMMSQVTVINITFIGKGGHGSAPQKANDPLQPAIDFHLKFREMINEFKAQGKEKLFVSTLPYFHVGEAENVIAEKAFVKGTLRSFDPKFTLEFKSKLNAIIDEVCDQYKCKADKRIITNYPAVMNHEKETDHVKRVASKIFGAENITEENLPVYASEDFSFFLEKKPGAFFFLGAAKKEKEIVGLHNSHYDFNDDIIEKAAEIWFRLAEDRFDLKL